MLALKRVLGAEPIECDPLKHRGVGLTTMSAKRGSVNSIRELPRISAPPPAVIMSRGRPGSRSREGDAHLSATRGPRTIALGHRTIFVKRQPQAGGDCRTRVQRERQQHIDGAELASAGVTGATCRDRQQPENVLAGTDPNPFLDRSNDLKLIGTTIDRGLTDGRVHRLAQYAPDRFWSRAQRSQDPYRPARTQIRQAEQQMLGRDPLMVQPSRLPYRELEHLLRFRGERDGTFGELLARVSSRTIF